MSTENRPAHSPLGASGAERWMNCPGSVALLSELKLPETDEPEYRKDGTAAHAAAYSCLLKDQEAWEIIGETHGERIVTDEMADAVQIYLDECRRIVEENPGGVVYNEFGIIAPDFHKDFYGTLDRGYAVNTKLFVRDFKYGSGIAVEIEWNPQIMYYAYGLLRHHPEVTEVDLGIVQPRIPYLEPVRTWVIDASSVREWAMYTLLPAMNRTELDQDLDAGPWCRFCPAKLVCPLMTSLFGAAMTADPKIVVNLSAESLGRSYQYTQAVKFYLKAMEEETFRRLNAGGLIPGVKLVPKKANRVFKDGAIEAFKILGADVWTVPELKSPAVMEKIGAVAKKLVHEWAFTPSAGLTVALSTDKRPAVKVQTTGEAFPNAEALTEAVI